MNPDKTIVEKFEYQPSFEQKERLNVLLNLVHKLSEQGSKFAVAGGYGLDALYGSLTRSHKDFDFVVADEDEQSFVDTVTAHGFVLSEIKDSGVVVYVHAEQDFELEYALLSILKKLTAVDDEMDGYEIGLDGLEKGSLNEVSVPTFSVENFKYLDGVQERRFGTADPKGVDKKKIYEFLSERES